jgi:hypothetical protein
VQQNHNWSILRAGLCIAHTQKTGIDLFQRPERRIRPRLDCGQLFRPGFLRTCRSHHPKLGGRKGHRCSANKAAASMINRF